MRLNEDFMKNFRWITPLILSVLTGLVGFMLQEIHETKIAAVEYTNLMVQQSNAQISWVRNDLQEMKLKLEKTGTDVTSIKTLLNKKLVDE